MKRRVVVMMLAAMMTAGTAAMPVLAAEDMVEVSADDAGSDLVEEAAPEASGQTFQDIADEFGLTLEELLEFAHVDPNNAEEIAAMEADEVQMNQVRSGAQILARMNAVDAGEDPDSVMIEDETEAPIAIGSEGVEVAVEPVTEAVTEAPQTDAVPVAPETEAQASAAGEGEGKADQSAEPQPTGDLDILVYGIGAAAAALAGGGAFALRRKLNK